MAFPSTKEIEIVKKGYSKDRYTVEQIDELKKCFNDPVYFCENYIKIQHPMYGRVPLKLYPFQREMIEAYHKNRFNVMLTAR